MISFWTWFTDFARFEASYSTVVVQMRDERIAGTGVRTLDPIRIHLGDLIDDVFGEPALPLGLSDLVWAAALCVDEVEDVEGHGEMGSIAGLGN